MDLPNSKVKCLRTVTTDLHWCLGHWWLDGAISTRPVPPLASSSYLCSFCQICNIVNILTTPAPPFASSSYLLTVFQNKLVGQNCDETSSTFAPFFVPLICKFAIFGQNCEKTSSPMASLFCSSYDMSHIWISTVLVIRLYLLLGSSFCVFMIWLTISLKLTARGGGRTQSLHLLLLWSFSSTFGSAQSPWSYLFDHQE